MLPGVRGCLGTGVMSKSNKLCEVEVEGRLRKFEYGPWIK